MNLGGRVKDWVPVALSSGLEPGGVMRAFIGDTDVVVWRTSTGRANAWNNRCPHRGMRLSFGFVRGDRLACLYHGWQYGEDAVCRYIPAHPDLEPPESIAATAYQVAERDGLIWVSLAESDAPDFPTYSAAPVRSLAIDADVDTVRAALDGAAFPISEDWTPGTGTVVTVASDEAMIILEGRAEGRTRTLVAALQPLPDDATMLHLMIDGDPSDGDPGAALKKRLSRWSERLRWFLENPDTPSTSWAPSRTQATGG